MMDERDAEFLAQLHDAIDDAAQGSAAEALAFLHSFVTVGRELFLTVNTEEGKRVAAERGLRLLASFKRS